jgi:hypothetical protein
MEVIGDSQEVELLPTVPRVSYRTVRHRLVCHNYFPYWYII